MKKILSVFGLLLLSTSAWANAKVIGNGGDPSEIRFKEVALNIQQWIESGNADEIHLPSGLTLDSYKTGMILSLKDFHVSFTQDKVVVSGAEKDCKNFVENGEREIVCNSLDFAQLQNSADDLYRLVHHEVAGLAGFEVNDGENSDYSLSNQISAYLRNEMVKRLPVQRPEKKFANCPNFTGEYRLPSTKQDEVSGVVETLTITQRNCLGFEQSSCSKTDGLSACSVPILVMLDGKTADTDGNTYRLVNGKVVGRGSFEIPTAKHGKCETRQYAMSLVGGDIVMSAGKARCRDGRSGPVSEVYPRN